MATKKPTLKKLKAFPDDKTIIFEASEMNWLKEKLGEHDSGYLAYARINQARIDYKNLAIMVDVLKARGLI